MPLRIAVDVQNLPKEPKTEVAEKATNPKTESQATTTNNKRSIKTEVFRRVGMGLAEGVLNHYGSFTGNYIQANQMKLAANLAITGVAFATNPLMTSIGLAFQVANSIATDYVQTRNANYISENIKNLYKGKGA
jgi:hypothetical protein